MKLFEDQKMASKRFEKWLNEEDTLTCGLWASAGFGKSYMAKYLINNIVKASSNYRPVLCSMTHSACKVLSGFLDQEVNTIHSVLGLIPMFDRETGDEFLSTPAMREKKPKPRLKEGDLVVVDEAGLMGNTELKYLISEAKKNHARILFIGDHKQLFPILNDDEQKCIPAYIATTCYIKLTEPKRVAKKDVLFSLATKYRDSITGGRQPKLKSIMIDGKGLKLTEDLEEDAIEAFKKGDHNKVKILCFTNERALTLNRKIRKKVLRKASTLPDIGEIMVANTTIGSSVDKEEILIRNNQLLRVIGTREGVKKEVKGAYVSFCTMEGETLEEQVFIAESPNTLREKQSFYQKSARKLARSGDKAKAKNYWQAYFMLKEECADIRYTYAMTVNKAQGITIEHALIDLDDINKCQDYEQKCRLAYTAVTRATTLVTVEGEITK
jgi:hypothetical protein